MILRLTHLSRLGVISVLAVMSFALPCQAADSQDWPAEVTLLGLLGESTPLETSAEEAYRVLVVPTFSEPFSLRLERTGRVWHFSWACLSGSGGYDPGSLAAAASSRISNLKVSAFIQALPSFTVTRDDADVICLDGTFWLYEHTSHQGYERVSQYCPERPFERAGELLAREAAVLFTEFEAVTSVQSPENTLSAAGPNPALQRTRFARR